VWACGYSHTMVIPMVNDVCTCGNGPYDQLGHLDWATSCHDQGVDSALLRTTRTVGCVCRGLDGCLGYNDGHVQDVPTQHPWSWLWRPGVRVTW